VALLEGRVALVTGASSGIGRATALAFAREGARVVVAARRRAESEATVDDIRRADREAIFVETDVTQAKDVERMVQAAVDRFGRLDCAFNNAGIPGETFSTVDCTEENWDRVMDVNLKGTWLSMKYEIRQMLAQGGGGVIVNDSSTAGLRGSGFGLSAYSASKHGVIGLTRTAAKEYGEKNIRIIAVCPSLVRTPMVEHSLEQRPQLERRAAESTALRRIARSEEVAETVLWLCSDRASFVTGAAIPVDGGSLA
jgi:NAD(P)-dependent dehydrogenase (short-subunit alcohol dehydrogenase family)